MKCFKLTDSKGKTRNNTQWGENVSHTATGTDPNLCSDGWIHFYMDPQIAVVMNHRHANFKSPILWEAEAEGEVIHESLKSGSKKLTTIKQIPLPEISLNQRIAFGIYCAKEVCKDEQWNGWADKWLSGEDRTQESAAVARSVVYHAAYHAAEAAYYAAEAARFACAAAAHVDNYSFVYSIANSIVNAADANNKIDFIALFDKAMLIK